MQTPVEQRLQRLSNAARILVILVAWLLVALALLLGSPHPPTDAAHAQTATSQAPDTRQAAPKQPTASITLRGHVLLQGRPTPPDSRWVTVVTGTLASDTGTCLTFTTLTDASGYFTVTQDLVPGTYQWRISGPLSQANAGTAALTQGVNTVEMGTLRTGDANGDNCTNAIDFNVLRATFGKSLGGQGYDERADFNADTLVSIGDFTMLVQSYGFCGAGAVCAPTPTPTPPPDPASIAPTVAPNLPTDFSSSTSFPYSGPNPIQVGVISGTIEMTRAAVLRGHVYTRAMAPLPGATVQVMDHPELGHTLSRADGAYDLAVNGGGSLVLLISADGYLSAERALTVPWQNYTGVDDVVMVPLDPHVTTISTHSGDPVQVARGSVISDSDGLRQDTLLFPAGTSAVITLPTGVTQTLSTFHVRTTEYTVGESGPGAMPGDLPQTSGYTQASEFSVDEAVAVGAKGVGFTQPVISYLENFLQFPVGSAVPTGYYDKTSAEWVASSSGLVVGVLTPTAGLANLDIHGQGNPATPAELAALGVTDAERARLATLYSPGQSLWRVTVAHFSPWDRNWGLSPSEGAGFPSGEPSLEPDEEGEDCAQGSIIGCQNQSLGEALDIMGVPFQLHYLSSRTSGYNAQRTLRIPMSGPVLPGSPTPVAMKLVVQVGGQSFEYRFGPIPNFTYPFTWDNTDAYNRPVQGCTPIQVERAYTYIPVYKYTDKFGYNGGGNITGNRARNEIDLWVRWSGCVGTWQAPPQELGGWSIGVHNVYDPRSKILYMGDGSKRSAEAIGPVISVAAGTAGSAGYSGDGGPATRAQLRLPTDLVVAPDGSQYIADYQNHRVRRVDPSGTITTVAGNGQPGYSGDGGPATQARLYSPYGIALGRDGSLYIADTDNNRIRKVDPSGVITTVAGNGAYGYSGDGGPATQAQLWSPAGVAVGPDGSLYIADTDNNRVRQVATDGTITTVAGTGAPGYSGDGGPARNAQLYHPVRAAVSRDGVVFVADLVNHRVRALSPDGSITTFAGNGTPGFSGDGGPATSAQLNSPVGLALGSDGTLYIADTGNQRVRSVGTDGSISTLAGNGAAGYSGDTGPAGGASLNGASGVGVSADGSVYLADTLNSVVRRIGWSQASLSLGELLIPSYDGAQAYIFDASGRHLRTVDALTGALVYSFAYDANGNLTDVVDGDNNDTHIERNQNGQPTAIVGPFGQRTSLSIGAGGYLSSITNAANETTSFTYGVGGLLTGMTDARQGQHVFHYDNFGRLTYDGEPDGSYKTLARVTLDNVYTVTLTTSLLRTTTFRVEDLGGGAQRRVRTNPDGTRTESVTEAGGNQTITYPDGSVRTVLRGPDPRWKMLAPIATSITYRMPSGLTVSTSQQTSVRLAGTDPLGLQALMDTITVNGRTVSYTYNAANSTLTNTAPSGRQQVVQLDGRGRPSSSQLLGLGPSVFSYDGRGRLSSASYGNSPGMRTESLNYNSQGFLTTITDTLGTAFGYNYDAIGRVVDEVLPLGRTNHFTYDANSNLTSIQPPGQPSHEFTYTSGNQQSVYTPPSAGGGTGPSEYAHNLDKQITQVIQPGPITTTYSYDSAGRPAAITHTLGSLAFGYAPTTGKLAQVSADHSVTTTFGYDGPLPTDIINTGLVSGTVHVTYDNNLRVTGQTIDGGYAVSYGYDQDGLLTGAGSLTASRNPQTGLLSGATLGGTSSTWSYNQFGEIITHTAAYTTSNLLAETTTRDNGGRVAQRVETIGGVTASYVYTYDAASRLTDVARNGLLISHYNYSPNSSRTAYTGPGGTITATYDAQDRLLQYGSLSYGYSPNGELLSKVDASTNQTTTYVYDALGSLRSVSLPGGTQVGYIVDGLDRRVGKTINGTLVQGFLYGGGLGPSAELDASGNVVSRFVYGTRAFVPDYMVKGGQTYYIVSDNLGSPRLVVNSATGQVAQRMDFDEFGNVLTDTNPGFQPFGFAGGLYDRDTGLVHFGARDYDPQTGRWTTKDPVRFRGGDTNLYSYAGQDPVNFVDPSGLNTVEISVDFAASYFVGVGASAGLVIDSDGNIGTFLTARGNAGVQMGISADISAGVSNAQTIDDFAGPFTEYNASLAAGPDLCAGVFSGDSDHGPVFGAQFGVGVGLGAGLNGGDSYTDVYHLSNVDTVMAYARQNSLVNEVVSAGGLDGYGSLSPQSKVDYLASMLSILP